MNSFKDTTSFSSLLSLFLTVFFVTSSVMAQTRIEKLEDEIKTQVEVNAGEPAMAIPGAGSEAGVETGIKSDVAKGPDDEVGFTESKRNEVSSIALLRKIKDRIKDPFMLPNHLYLTVKKKLSEVVGEGYVDDSVEPQKRWALKYYKVVAIISNVKSPKAMVTDKMKDLHIFRIGDRIGNNGGVVASIGNGQMIVRDSEIETTLRLERADK